MHVGFTDRARKVMQLANEEARRLQHEYVGTEHLLLGLASEGSGVAANVLKNLDVDLAKIRREVEKIVQSGPPDTATTGVLPQTPRAKKVIEYAMEESRAMGHGYAGTEHLLLGLLREEEGVAAQVLMNLGLGLDEVRKEVLHLLGHGVTPPANFTTVLAPTPRAKNCQTPAIDSFAVQIPRRAKGAPPLRLIGREDELRRVMAILCRRTVPNPLVLGPAGVGKTALVEGLAQALLDDDVPARLAGRRVMEIQLAHLVSGAKYRGEVGERLVAMLQEARRAGDVVLFVDEVHDLVRWYGAEFSRSLRVSRGVPWIGACSLQDYGTHVAGDSVIVRYFHPVVLGPCTKADAVAVLNELRGHFEQHHGVAITDAAIAAAVERSDEYLPDRCLPAKAVDVIDEAAAHCRIMVATALAEELNTAIRNADSAKMEALQDGDFVKAAAMHRDGQELRKKRKALFAERGERAGCVDEEMVSRAIGFMARAVVAPQEKETQN